MCDRGRFPDDRIPYERVAEEYASLLRDVTAAVHARFDRAQVKVANGGLAPGGTRWCECIGAAEGGAYEAGITSREFLSAMDAAVPGVFDSLDAFASHSYPAEGEGWGFFVPYEQSLTGLRYYQTELTTIGRPDLGVLMTETGWRRDTASDSEVATWTRQAYENVWLTDDGLIAIMPFILLDVGGWDHFAWVDGSGTPRPVYDEIRALRCSMIGGRC